MNHSEVDRLDESLLVDMINMLPGCDNDDVNGLYLLLLLTIAVGLSCPGWVVVACSKK